MNNNENNNALNIFSQPVNNGRAIQPIVTEEENTNNQLPTQQESNEIQQPQNTFFQTKLPTQTNTESASEKRRFNPFGDGYTLQAQAVSQTQVNPQPTQPVQSDAPKTIDSIISNLNSDKAENFVISDESLLRAYIGSSYDIITNKSFNFSAFFFNGGYFLYRKVYDIGCFFLAILLTCFLMINDYAILFILLLFTNIICGFIFNKIYVNKSKKSIERIKRKYKNEKIKSTCIKAGGTSIIGTVIFLVIFITMVIFLKK